MILRLTSLITAIGLIGSVRAEVAPEITVLQEGYSLVAKIPCLGCPFLFQDTSKGSDEPWTERKDDNALLINVSLPYDSAFLSLNNAALYSGQRNLPAIYANQVVQDFSVDDLAKVIESGQLEASHETTAAGGFFGVSYRQSLRNLKTTQGREALVFQFDVFELHSELLTPPLLYRLEDANQKVLEVVLVRRPLLSVLQPAPTYEIFSASLIQRPSSLPSTQRTMSFLAWDTYGQKGTAAHALTYGATSFVDYIASGFWGLFVFIMGTVILFVVVCLICIFGFGGDDYERAQSGKRRRSKATGDRGRMRGDVEKGRFKSAEELGLLGRGRVVGVGKSD